MEQEIHITLRFNFAIGKVTLNEIVYRLKELRDPLMLRVLEQILCSYDDLISERLSQTRIYPSKARKGLGRHIRGGDPEERVCRGRKIKKRGYRGRDRVLSTVFGKLHLPLRVAKCCTCGALYSPVLSALNVGRYARKESNFEHEVIEAVIDTNYRRLVDGRSIDISLGGIHNLVVGSDVDRVYQESVSLEDLSGILADGTGVKESKGRKGELKAVIGVTRAGRVEPLGTFTNTEWSEIEQTIKERIKEPAPYHIPFIYDGEPGLDDFLADSAEESVFAAVGLPFIPPELREDGGEIEAALAGRLPHLLERGDLQGDLHVRTGATDGTATLAGMADAARAAGLGYIACTDHSRYLGAYRGLDAKRLGRQLDEIDRLNAGSRSFCIFKGIEVDILEDGSLALPDDILAQLDLVVGAVHGHFGLGRRKQTERLLKAIDHPHFSILAHPAARLLGEREPIDFDLERITRHCAERGSFLELNSQPQRLDMDDAACRLAAGHGVLVSIASDAHRPEDFANLEWGVTQARRGWLGAAQVLNTLPAARLRQLLRRTMR